ncbi:hypothetical protein GCM10008955_42340 [Deinococcus malanensis]|uniref:Uncharacterized protein n=1 Tax=Deinococcus malanensis TaxID=1706855 RepID=A0ABQ2F6A4_9DEIO|nr:hypothetical protein GCM10008955_42340 [Deinococcus malanensis]
MKGRLVDYLSTHLAPVELFESLTLSHAGAPGVQKALEQQVVLDRVGERDAQQVTQHGPGR